MFKFLLCLVLGKHSSILSSNGIAVVPVVSGIVQAFMFHKIALVLMKFVVVLV